MSSPTVYFVTGSNRGIRLALVKEIAKRANVYIFAGARKTSAALDNIISENPDKVSFVPFIAADEKSNKEAAKIVADKFGKVDVVLGVAGIANYLGRVDETPVSELEEHFRVNVTGILVLFQAFVELLKKSATPKFIPFSSGAGSLTAYIHAPFGHTAYGGSKAAMNYLSRKIHFENEWLISFPLAPGVVDTDMAVLNRNLDKSGVMGKLQEEMSISPEVAGVLLMDIVDNATRESHGGEFMNVDGSKVTW